MDEEKPPVDEEEPPEEPEEPPEEPPKPPEEPPKPPEEPPKPPVKPPIKPPVKPPVKPRSPLDEILAQQQVQAKAEEGKPLEYLYDFGSILGQSELRYMPNKPKNLNKNLSPEELAKSEEKEKAEERNRAPVYAFSSGGAVNDYDAVTMELLKFLRR